MKIKKELFTVLLTLSISIVSVAQFTNCKTAEIEKLKQNGTVVVAVSDDEETNKLVAEIMKSYWTASKYNVIKKSGLDVHLKANPENYVLTYLVDNLVHVFYRTRTQMGSNNTRSTTTNRMGNSRSQSVGDGLILTKNLKKLKKLKPTDAMVYCFIDPDMNLINEQAEFIRQLGAINSILTFPDLKDNQIGAWKIPTINYKDVIAKELWVVDEDLNEKGKDETKMKSAYEPYKYKIVSKEDLANAIIEKRKDIAYTARAEYQAGAYMFVVHSSDDNRVLFFLGGTGGFDSKALDKIKNNKAYGQ